jgi:hypothetical protein
MDPLLDRGVKGIGLGRKRNHIDMGLSGSACYIEGSLIRGRSILDMTEITIHHYFPDTSNQPILNEARMPMGRMRSVETNTPGTRVPAS